MNSTSIYFKSVFLLLLCLSLSQCQRGRAMTNYASAEDLIQGAEQGVEAPSLSLDDYDNSTVEGLDELNDLTDTQIAGSLFRHLQQILANLQTMDTGMLPYRVVEILPDLEENLEEKLEEIKKSPETRKSFIEKIRSGKNKTFFGGYEGKKQQWERFKQKSQSSESNTRACERLEKLLQNEQMSGAPFMQKVSEKYGENCSGQ